MPESPDGAGGLTRAKRAVWESVEEYLRDHHVMTLSTFGSIVPGGTAVPHAATVFYAFRRGDGGGEWGSREGIELIFAGKADSRHGRHLAAAGAKGAPAAAAVSEHYSLWRDVRGVQLWGRAFMLFGVPRVAALAVYLVRFPFVAELLKNARGHHLPATIALFSLQVERAAYTDNSTGVFGRSEVAL